MPLPALTQHGLLPDGVHDCSIEDVERAFGSADSSSRRRELFRRLQEYVQEVRSTGWNTHLIIDGSFVMGTVAEPHDVDLILVLPHDWDMHAEVRPFEYNLIAPRRTRRRFGFDVYAVPSGSIAERNWIGFFSGVDRKWVHELGLPSGIRKGLLRVRV